MCSFLASVFMPRPTRICPPKTGKFTAHHSTFQELSDFFKTSEALEAAKKEKQIQARWVSTTLLAAIPLRHHQP